ncbi:MAG: glycosyltransferase family 4 protein [Legionellaceae bacterium]|nr:glycosyltransferase family 4 protein [Legionellaceae bacterium]
MFNKSVLSLKKFILNNAALAILMDGVELFNLKKVAYLMLKTSHKKSKIKPKAPLGKKILMLTISMIEIDCRINKVASSLAAKGYQVTIFCPELPNQDQPIVIQDIAENIKYIRIKATHLTQKIKMSYQSHFVKASADFDFDFVHANDLTTLATGWVISKQSGVPLVYDSHEMWSENVTYKNGKYVQMQARKRFFYQKLEGRLLRDVTLFYSVSASILDEYERRHQYRPKLLANYPDIASLAHDGSGFDSLKSSLNLTPEHFITLYIGGVGPGRNIENVIKAHAKLDEHFVFVIRGPGVEFYGPEYMQLAASLNIQHRIFILPAVGRDDVVAASNGADCGIVMLENLCKNFYWFYPNKFFEYSLAGLPVAVSNFPDVRAHIEREQNGITFEPSNPQSIADALFKLDSNRVETNLMGKRGQESIHHTYNWEAAISTMIKDYDALLA